jgi:Regulator of chromosome condensation (RCC1) repeat
MSQVACGSSFMLALSEGGDVFAWGDNRCVQLGVSASAPVTPCARPYSGAGTGYPGSPPILQSYFSPSSSSQSPFTSDSGRVEASHTGTAPYDPKGYSRSISSQLPNSISGELKTVMSCRPVLVESLRQVRVTAVACGALHSLCLSEEGQVYSWGRAAGGRLGQLPDRVGIPDNTVGKPALVRSSWETIDFDLFPPSSKPSPEANMLSARMEDYYSFSSAAVNGVQPYETESDHDSLADERTSPRRPTSIPFFKGGRDSRPTTPHTHSSSSSAYIQTSQEMVNSFPPTPRASSPSSPNRVVCISAGFSHSLAVTACGGVFSWGCGTHGRLGHGSHCDEYLPRQVTLPYSCSSTYPSASFLIFLYSVAVYLTVLRCIALHYTVLYCIFPYCIALHSVLLYCMY